MRRGNPLFVDITWGAGGNPGGDAETSSIKIAETSVQYLGLETMLHMTCVGAGKDEITGHLDKAKRKGLRNILALRGDLPTSEETWEYVPGKFNFGTDLVRHIRQEFGEHFPSCGEATGRAFRASSRADVQLAHGERSRSSRSIPRDFEAR